MKQWQRCLQMMCSEILYRPDPYLSSIKIMVFAEMQSAPNCCNINFAILGRVFCNYFNSANFNASLWIYVKHEIDRRRSLMLSSQVQSLLVETDINLSNSNHCPWEINTVCNRTKEHLVVGLAKSGWQRCHLKWALHIRWDFPKTKVEEQKEKTRKPCFTISVCTISQWYPKGVAGDEMMSWRAFDARLWGLHKTWLAMGSLGR